MKRLLLCLMLLAVGMGVGAGFAEAGQYRLAPPKNLRKRQPPRDYRDSRLEIVNDDDRGYAIDVDYRRNRLELQPRERGDIFVPARSSVTLVFDDDDDWRIYGDNKSLAIEIRSGRTTTLRLETRVERDQIGLFGIVESGNRRRSAQLFKYAVRPRRPGANRPPVQAPKHPEPPRPAPQHPGPQRPGQQQPGPQRPGQQHPGPQQPAPQHPGPQRPGQQQPNPQQPGQSRPGTPPPGQQHNDRDGKPPVKPDRDRGPNQRR